MRKSSTFPFDLYIAMVLLSSLALLFNSCKKENVNNIECNTSGLNPDSILYSTTISVIIKHNCISCHRSSLKKGWVNLEGYEHVKKYADNHKLLGSIAHLNGYAPMPRDADKLSQEDICKIKIWIDNGALNN